LTEQNEELDELVTQWRSVKLREEDAKLERYALEERIADAVGRKSEGSTTREVAGGKLKLTHRVNRTLDADAFERIRGELPAGYAENLVRYKASLVLDHYRWLEENDPETFRILARAVTSKPSKVGVSFEEGS